MTHNSRNPSRTPKVGRQIVLALILWQCFQQLRLSVRYSNATAGARAMKLLGVTTNETADRELLLDVDSRDNTSWRRTDSVCYHTSTSISSISSGCRLKQDRRLPSINAASLHGRRRRCSQCSLQLLYPRRVCGGHRMILSMTGDSLSNTMPASRTRLSAASSI